MENTPKNTRMQQWQLRTTHLATNLLERSLGVAVNNFRLPLNPFFLGTARRRPIKHQSPPRHKIWLANDSPIAHDLHSIVVNGASQTETARHGTLSHFLHVLFFLVASPYVDQKWKDKAVFDLRHWAWVWVDDFYLHRARLRSLLPRCRCFYFCLNVSASCAWPPLSFELHPRRNEKRIRDTKTKSVSVFRQIHFPSGCQMYKNYRLLIKCVHHSVHPSSITKNLECFFFGTHLKK